MTLILTNDDGIDAPGMAALCEALDGRAIAIAAPRDELSGCGHQVTTRNPIHVDRRSSTSWAIAGTPADCTRIALSHLYPEASWVISGINSGGNMGVDIYISGTVAAVREAAFHGVPGIAISQYRQGGRPVNWDITTHWASRILADLLDRPPEPGCFWNVNLPYLEPGDREPEIVLCENSAQPLPIDYHIEGDYFHYCGRYGDRPREIGTDVDVCFSGNIAITQLSVRTLDNKPQRDRGA
ncbi:MAG: 5'/3'-nucleotidase SurE [Cyanobacteria bacterium J007]|nr:MAG: 5'/3'-nucleotidase SurE [Cyanobacteria bacterium J007]